MKMKNIRDDILEKKRQDVLGEEDEKKAQYCQEKFEKDETQTLCVRNRKSFVIVRLRLNMFGFRLNVG